MTYRSSRRQFVTGGAALGATLLSGFPARSSSQVVVATWGGDTERALRESAGAIMQDRHGVDVLFDTGTPSARKTKLLAEANRPVNSLDVVHLTDIDTYQMNRQGVLAELDRSQIPNLANTFPEFVKSYSIPTFYSALVLVYNKNHVSGMSSWRDFWRPEYAGKIGFTDLSYDKIVPIASWTFGDTTDDYAVGKEALMELKKNGVRIYPSNEAAGNAFASGEIVAAIQWKGRAIQWANAGLPLEFSVPSEGGFPSVFEMAMARNSGASAQAAQFLNAMLEPTSQIAAAKAIGQAPIVDNVELSGELEAVSFTDAERANFIRVNYEYASNQAAALLDWWQQEFKAS